MDDIRLTVPEPIRDALPADSEDAVRDMERAVAGWQTRINRAIAETDTEDDAVSVAVDALERFEARWEQYDDFVAELRAWGQSPIYAMAWRDLQAALVSQLYEHEDLADRLDRERHARILDDGIRPK